MINLVHAEFYKLGKSLSLKICILLSCISAGALTFISHGIAEGSIGLDISGSASGLTEIVIIALLGSLMTGFLICNDFESKTIHDAVACGNGRIYIILSKTLVYLFVMIIILIPFTMVTLIGIMTGAAFAKPFVPSVFIKLLYENAGQGMNVKMVADIIIISIVTSLVHAARLSICLPLAFKIRKPVVILAIGFTFDAVIDLIIGLLKDVPLIKDLFTYTPYARNFLLVSSATTSGILVKAVVCSVVFIGFMAALTYMTFRKAEIK